MAMKPRKRSVKMRGGGMAKKPVGMRGGGMAKKPEMMMKKGGKAMTLAQLRAAAKQKGFKLVKTA